MKPLVITLLFLSVSILNARKPNIVLVMADDLGIECIGSYGGESYYTPNLDKMASEGMRFTHAYSTPLCTPTRLQIMTGKYNHKNWLYFGILPPNEKTFGHMMQDFGYKTCIAGKWQLQSYDPPEYPGSEQRRGTGMHPEDAGFDEYSLFHALHTEDKGSRYANPTYLQNGELFSEAAGKYGEDISVDFILEFMGKYRDEPMFIYYPMALPHWPVNPTPISEIWHKNPEMRLDDDLKYFKDMVEYMDILIGRLILGINGLGLGEDTLILFYSDNGTDRKVTSIMNGQTVQGGKNQTSQAGIRVPMLARWSGTIEAGSINTNLIDPSDFLPTLAALAGERVPSAWDADGLSFADQLLGQPTHARDWVYCWYDPRPGWDKDQFHREIFALDKHYKYFLDGRFYKISKYDLQEVWLDTEKLSDHEQQAKAKLASVIEGMLADYPQRR